MTRIFHTLLFTLLLAWQPAAAQQATGGISASAIRQLLEGQGDNLAVAVGQIVTRYPAQAPAAICGAVNMNPAMAQDVIAAALQAGAGGEQIPPACECAETDDGVVALVQGALANEISAADIASRCMNETADSARVSMLLSELLARADRSEYEFILGIAYDVLTDLGVNGAEDILVNALVDGEFLSFDSLSADCGEACLRPAAETLVQGVVDVQQGGGLAGDLYGGPGQGGQEPPLSAN